MSRAFDNVDDSIELSDDGFGTAVTCCCWVYPRTYGEGLQGRILDYSTANERYLFFAASNGIYANTYRFSVLTTTTAATSAASNGILLTNRWQFLAASYDDSATPRVVTLYYNGFVVPSYLEQVSAGGTIDASNDGVPIIGNNRTRTRTWDGFLAHFQFYNRVLSQNEIRQLMFYPGSIRQGLNDYLPLWGTSSPEPDYSGNNYAGTLSGSTVGLSEAPINGIFTIPKPQLTGAF